MQPPDTQTAVVSRKPWDARLALLLVRPLRNSRVSPGHLTTLRLLVGLGAAASFAVGLPSWANAAALLFVLSNFLDHADGELARVSGKITRSGHYYDLACDAIVHTLLFVGIGYGLRHTWLGDWALPMGVLSGLSISSIFWLRIEIERRLGKTGSRLPGTGGFEIEDILYLMPLVTWCNALVELLIAAVVGAPVFAAWLIWRYGSL